MPQRSLLTVIPDNPVEAFRALEEVKSYTAISPFLIGIRTPHARELEDIYFRNLRKKFFPSFPGPYAGESL